jgi:hypothetical protein
MCYSRIFNLVDPALAMPTFELALSCRDLEGYLE